MLYLDYHKLKISTNAVPVIPGNYEILSAAGYEDPACDPLSSKLRNVTIVNCFPRQATGATPRLTDGVLGPDYLTITTDYAYILDGPPTTTFEAWIELNFAPNIMTLGGLSKNF